MLGDMTDRIRRIASTARFAELYAAGWTLGKLASFYGVHKSEISLAVEYLGLPRRVSTPDADMAPNADEESASMDSLALAPAVEARARKVRELHYADRRREPDSTTQVAIWRREHGKCRAS
jgi:hypothetical protein